MTEKFAFRACAGFRSLALAGTSFAALVSLGGGEAAAQALQPGYSPAANNGGGSNPGRADIITDSGTTGTISGDYKLRGTSARRFRFESLTVAERQARGEVLAGYDQVDGKVNVALGADQKRTTVVYPDQIKGTTVATTVYSNDLLKAVNATSRDTAAYYDTGAPVYGDLRLADINASKITIATGNKAKSVYDTVNLAIVTADSGSTLYNVTAASNIVYDSVTATMSGIDQDGLRQRATQDYDVKVTSFSGVAFNGNDKVTDLESLKRYNTSIIAQLQAGTITPSQYESLIQAAAQTTTRTVTVRNDPLDRYHAPPTTSERLFIKLDGSTLVTTADSRLVGMAQADKNTDGGNTLVLAQNGSAITNNGVIAQAGAAPGIRLDGAGTSLTNSTSGVVGIGYEVLDRSSGVAVPTGNDSRAYTTNNVAILASNGATVLNEGIINVANRDIASLPNNPEYGKANVGIAVGSGASVANRGTILIGGGDSVSANQLGSFGGAVGIVASSGGSALNAAGGTIRVGTTFAENATDLAGVRDVVSVNPASGMTSINGGGSLVNAGTIRLGSLVQNGAGMTIAGDGGTAVNGGAIIIDPSAATSPTKRNTAISVLGSSVAGATNALNAATGVITIGGVNGVGLLVENGVVGGSARAVNDGTIIVDGGISSDRLRNYGIYVANASSSAVQNGSIQLTGEGAIGVHARNGGVVDITSGGTVDFRGVRQIGYYALGAGSSIGGISTTTVVDTRGSTGLRVEGGAVSRSSGQSFLVSGQDAIGIVGTGASVGTTVDASGVRIEVSGSGATGLLIEGGATGVISGASDIRLTGASTTAAVVDGQAHDIDGVAVGGPVAGTLLTANANLTSSFNNVSGYIARNGAALVNSGSIGLTGAGSTGIRASTGATVTNSGSVSVDGAGSVGLNLTGAGTTAVHSGTIGGRGVGIRIAEGAAFTNNGTVAMTSGTGILLDGATSVLAGTGASAVRVDDGTAALRLTNAASATTAGSFTGGGTAHAVLIDNGAGALTLGAGSVTSTGTGNGIENRNSANALRLDGTAVTANGSGSAIRTAVALVSGSTATVTAAGTNSIGFDYRELDGGPASGDLVLDAGMAITGSGAGAIGARLNTTGAVRVTGQISVTNAQGGAAIVTGPVRSLDNSGTLRSISVVAPVVDLSGGAAAFSNSGTITAATSSATAIRGGDNGQAVTQSAGTITGAIRLGNGSDTFLMTGGTLDGAFSAGAGNDNATFRGITDANIAGLTDIGGNGVAGGADTLTFDASRTTGTRRITGWNAVNLTNGSTLTSDGDLLLVGGGAARIDSGSTYFAGNGTRAVLGAATGGTATITNAGIIDLTNGGSGATDTLTIRGNYVGQNGVLRLQTVLGSDGSASDRLIIDGGSVSGTTTIQVTNLGGLGARTTGDGIELVSAINGGTTTALTTGTGFVLAGEHVDAGAFEYRLFASNLAGTNQSWYLRTQANTQTEIPTDPGTPTPVDTTFRPEVPLLASLSGALRRDDLAMLGTYHRRMGDETESASIDPSRAQIPGRFWGRALLDDGVFRSTGDARQTSDGRVRGFQLGANLFRYGTAGGEMHFGVYGGYSEGRYDTLGYAGGVENRAVGRLDPETRYAALYWSYLANSGFYFDTVVQGSWYRGDASASTGTKPKIHGSGVLASVELGYALPLSPSWSIEPQVQLVAQGTSLDPTAIPNATVRYADPGHLTGRAGVRVRGRLAGGLQPYVRANLWKTFAATDRTLFVTPAATTIIRSPESALWGETGAGLTWTLGSRLSLYGEVDYRKSLDDGRGLIGHSTSASVGLKFDL